jgi:hypothetical protein
MHIPTHILSGWCIGNCFGFTPRERLLCMIAASIADIDGLGFFFSEEVYWRLHHSLGHNVFFGVMAALAMAVWSKRWATAFAVYVGLFHLHLLMDYFGSGPGWLIHYLWPLSEAGWKTHLVWNLFSWQNLMAAGILLAWTGVIAYVARRTPLELIAPRLDRRCCDFLHDARRQLAGDSRRSAAV